MTGDSPLPCLWMPGAKADECDYHVAFRGAFDVGGGEVEIRILGASWFNAWIDGRWLAEGPARFSHAHPEYQSFRLKPGPGRHVLAVQVHAEGVETRIVGNIPPFLWCEARSASGPVAVRWTCLRLGGYVPKVRRINALLGWMDWCDTRGVPTGWQEPGFDDGAWVATAEVTAPVGRPALLSAAETIRSEVSAKVVASGEFLEMFGYDRDNPPTRFFLRELAPGDTPAQGVWRRYDLGRVRLMRPVFTLDLPPGAVVEFGYSESLQHGRVCPWISLSTSDSANMDHYQARGGVQQFSPHGPRGGRFVEVHVIAPPSEVRFVEESFIERGYYGSPDGAFRCGDAMLDRIWEVGVETHRACAEDALVDTPTRERGQWAGDVVTVGMEIAGVAFSDLRLCRRGLHQCAQSARADGLVAGMCPGQDIYLSTYAAQWVNACVHYWELTGDKLLLEELFAAAERNISAFEAKRTPIGVETDAMGWAFVDWGYVRNPGSSDMAVNLHYLSALRAMRRWCTALGRAERAASYAIIEKEVAASISAYYAAERAAGGDAWDRIGYHRAILGLKLGFFSGADVDACIAHTKAHILRCFPNDPTGPRLSDPAANNPRLITPYFAHFAMPELIERGQMDFVLDQFRHCWGWALSGGITTWIEVFDTRWSHCHQWSGCPTWILSRYVLGLDPAFDLGPRHYRFRLNPGSLPRASGRLPVPGGGSISISWERAAAGVHYKLETPEPIHVHFESGPSGKPAVVTVPGRFEGDLRLPA
jgi:alpha-L-rhamnosidase